MNSVNSQMDQSERLARLALFLGVNCNGSAFHRVIRHCGSAVKAFDGEDLRFLGINLTPLLSVGLFEAARAHFDYAAVQRIDIIIWGDEYYPFRLTEVLDPPPVLWVKGRLEVQDQFAVSLVGSRRASEAAMKTAWRLAREGTASGVCIVSGLAKGIDGAAHRGALSLATGRTLAVLGCGLDHVYPKENARLYQEIAERGALISEFLPETPPISANFPRRNRVIAALSLAVIVVEAPLRSGALITARLALDLNREVMAVPGQAGDKNCEGSNRLIKDGAALVENMAEVLAEIKPRLLEGLSVPHSENSAELESAAPETARPELQISEKPSPPRPVKNRFIPQAKVMEQAFNEKQAKTSNSNLASPEGNQVLDLLKNGPQDADSLTRALKMESRDMAVLLMQLELDGLVLRQATGQYLLNH